MARPKCCRKVSGRPACSLFRPMGAPSPLIDEVMLSLDEFESIRLADFEGLYQEKAAEIMGVSRQTFGRILECARRKLAKAIVFGSTIRIAFDTGEARLEKVLQCRRCDRMWAPSGSADTECPECKSPGTQCAGEARRSGSE